MADVTNITTSLGDMVEQVYFLISERDGSSVIKREYVIAAINDAFSRIYNKSGREKTDVYTTVSSGTRSIVVPDAVNQRGNILVDQAFFDSEALAPGSFAIDDLETGTPTSYAVQENAIYLMPTPDADGELRLLYRREFVPLVEDSDEVIISDVAIDAAIRYACYLMKLKDEEYAAADRFKQEWDEYYKESTGLQTGVYKASVPVSYGGAV